VSTGIFLTVEAARICERKRYIVAISIDRGKPWQLILLLFFGKKHFIQEKLPVCHVRR